jgi:hypothetical protein
MVVKATTLAPTVYAKLRTPPGLLGSDHFQILWPKQPTLPVRETHIDGHVAFSPVKIHDSTHHAASLGDPVTLAHLYRRADLYFFWFHDVPLPVEITLDGVLVVNLEGEFLSSHGHVTPRRRPAHPSFSPSFYREIALLTTMVGTPG